MEINRPTVVAEVTAAFQRYEIALVNNDIETLDTLFWNSEFTLRYGPSENLYGIEAIRAFRQSRVTIDLARELTHTVITTFDDHTATANTEYRRQHSGRVGRQSQTWVRLPEGWRIVAAHVSWLAAE